MKTTHKHTVVAAVFTGALILTSAHAQTPDSVQTRIGPLSFERGYPTAETTRKVFDEIDYQRAVQAHLWAYPAVSFESVRLGSKRDLGADLNDFVIADNYADPKAVWLTANDTTIYALMDLGKTGPLVVRQSHRDGPHPPGKGTERLCDELAVDTLDDVRAGANRQ